MAMETMPPETSTDPCLSWLRKCLEEHPTSASLVSSATAYYERRLWHQLTQVLERLCGGGDESEEAAVLPPALLRSMYSVFVETFRENLNPLKLAQIAVVVAKRSYGSGGDDDEEEEGNGAMDMDCDDSKDDAKKKAPPAETFLQKVLADLAEDLTRNPTNAAVTHEASLYIRAHVAQCRLVSGDHAGCKQLIEECKEAVESTNEIDASVHASVHYVHSQLTKSRQDFQGFYRSALLYLSYVDDASLSIDVRRALAVDLSLAALLGKDIYNFGELLQHSVASSLDGTDYEWLHGVIKAFHAGDLAQYDALLATHGASFDAQPGLRDRRTELREKIQILSVMQLIFSLPSDDRTIAMAEIGRRTGRDTDGVKRLTMRALSVHLVEGSLDSVAGEVTITWVQPRVLTRPEVVNLSEKIDVWIDKVNAIKELVAA